MSDLIIMALLNLLTAFIMGKLFILFTNDSLFTKCFSISQLYESNGILTIFIGAFICGLCLYYGLQTGKPLAIIACVVFFILSGGRHSVADMFYLSIGGMNWKIIITCLGNICGSWFIPIIKEASRN